MARTRDGVGLYDLVKAATDIDGVTYRQGGGHLYMLNYANMRPCPVAESTDAKRMVVPWLRQIVDENKDTIYTALKKGRWIAMKALR